jgi:hypothetical protein
MTSTNLVLDARILLWKAVSLLKISAYTYVRGQLLNIKARFVYLNR